MQNKLKLSIAGCVLIAVTLPGRTQTATDWPSTRAEKSNYRETSTLDDVSGFLDSLRAHKAPITVQTIGKSVKGRDIPLVIVASPMVKSAAEARRQGKLVVYLQANIHGGEVEGKESVQILMRKLSMGELPDLMKRLVLLVTPIYNIDGNDKMADVKKIRGSQDGPDLVGERANGAGMDLNRDCMKVESPEMQAVLKHVYNAWDPDLMMDLHTTNGTRHGFQLTYSPPLNPNTDPGIMTYSRDELLPVVSKTLEQKDNYLLFDYGNAESRNGVRVWATFGEEGRYVTNYAGLRNRIAILSEAASFLPFKTRIDVTLRFVEEVLTKAAKDSTRIRTLVKEADRRTVLWGKSVEAAGELGVRFEMAQGGKRELKLEKVHPGERVDHSKAPTEYEPFTLDVYDRFKSTRYSHFPAAYIVPSNATKLLEVLRQHGIRTEMIDKPMTCDVERFKISEAKNGAMFQGHRMTRIEGSWTSAPGVVIPVGSTIVRTAQPLGVLIFNMLEPESTDGAISWELLAAAPQVGEDCAIMRVLDPKQIAKRSQSGAQK